MHKLLRWAATLLCVGATGSAAAAGGTVTDQAANLTYAATHWSALPAANLIGVDATGDPLYQTGWWYRAEGDTREYPLPVPDSETYSGGRVTAVWNNLDGKGFEVREFAWAFDNEGPSGGFLSYLVVKNNNAVAKQFTSFHYLDVDMAATKANDTGSLVNRRFLKFQDGVSRASYRAVSWASHYQVGTFSGLRDLLNDTAVTTLSDAGLPFGPGDATAAYQFGPSTVNPGSSAGGGMVSAFFNPASDHVKGDYYGLGLAALYGQPPDLAGRSITWMRRTGSIGLITPFNAPTGASIVGVDDFDADFSDEVVYRKTATGAAYVGFSLISGAPTLPLSWKLSATGDFDADGRADILWRNTDSQKLVIWTMNGNAKVGSIVPSPDQAVDANWEAAAAADFNRDGNRDLLWYNQTSGKIVLWFMNASVVRIAGQVTNPSSVGSNAWRVLAAGDYGKGAGGILNSQDLVWQNDTSKRLVVWHMDLAGNRTAGTFTSPDTLQGTWDLVGPR